MTLGTLGDSLGVQQIPWDSLGPFGIPENSTRLFGTLWNSLGVDELPGDLWELLGCPADSF